MQTSLYALTNQELLSNVSTLVRCDRQCTAKLIAHLAEIERRSLHLELGFKSMFDYCQRELQLEESQTWLRLQVARKSVTFPQVLEEIIKGTLSLTVCGRLAPHLTEENCAKVLADCRGMTKAQVEEYLVSIKPKPVVKGGIRKSSEPAKPLFAEASEAQPKAAPAKPAKVKPATPERFNVSVSIGKETKAKLDRLAEVLGKGNAGNHLEEILDLALDAALDKKDPIRKAERVETRKQKKNAGVSKLPKAFVLERRRTPVAEVKRSVLQSAGYQCCYIGPDGRRCTQRMHLQVDHVTAWGKGGESGKENLQVLCRAHNLYKAKREYGEKFIEAKIADQRKRLSAAVLG